MIYHDDFNVICYLFRFKFLVYRYYKHLFYDYHNKVFYLIIYLNIYFPYNMLDKACYEFNIYTLWISEDHIIYSVISIDFNYVSFHIYVNHELGKISCVCNLILNMVFIYYMNSILNMEV